MSRFTDELYGGWLGQNGVQSQQTRGGMGGMPPMVTTARVRAPGNTRSAALNEALTPPRHDKQSKDYVNKSQT